LTVLFVCQGVKLQCLQREGKSTDPETRRAADHVSALTTTGPFNYAHYTAIQPVALAMGSHMRFLEAYADNPQERDVLIDLLKTDLRAMSLLGEKFKFVPARYAGLISTVESTIKQYEERQQLMQLYSSMRIYSDVLGEAHSAVAARPMPQFVPLPPLSVPNIDTTSTTVKEEPGNSMLNLLYGTDEANLQLTNSNLPLFDIGEEFLEDLFAANGDSPENLTGTGNETIFL
jgi:hypothetical protein